MTSASRRGPDRQAQRRAAEEAEARLFEQAMRDVRPLAGTPPLPQPPPPERPPPVPAVAPLLPPAPAPPAAPTSRPLPTGAGVDRRTADRLRRGRFAVDARLDLHGMVQSEAHRVLPGFVGAAHATGRRCLLVVTGKGRPMVESAGAAEREERGVLRRNVPRWLAQPGLAEKVLATAPARPEDGGDGALYVLLRRRRERGEKR